MSKHYILIEEADWAGPTPKLLQGPDIDLTRGRLETVDEPFEFLLEVDKQADKPLDFPPLDFAATVNQPLFSARFQAVLARAGVDNIQYFPAKVIYAPTGQEVDYQVANVIGVARALDTDASECDVDEDGFVDDFETMVLDEDKLLDLDFVRLFEMLNIIVISEKVADAINEAQLSGLRVMDPSEWEPGII